MSLRYILLITLLSLYSFQSLRSFSDQFLIEINKIKPSSLILDKPISRILLRYFNLYDREINHTIKKVDITDIHKTCNLDFEIQLVQGFLPKSDHQIAHINVGGALTPGQKIKYTNKWVCKVGVAIENENEPNSVYLLVYDISTERFSKNALMKDIGIDIRDIDEMDLVNYYFYYLLFTTYNEVMHPVVE